MVKKSKFKPGDLVYWVSSVHKEIVINNVVSKEEALKLWRPTAERVLAENPKINVVFIRRIGEVRHIGWMPEKKLKKATKAMKVLYGESKNNSN